MSETVFRHSNEPNRIGFHYAVRVTGRGFRGCIVRDGFDYRIAEFKEEPWQTTDPREATKEADRVAEIYERLRVRVEVEVVKRGIYTYVGDWEVVQP